MSVSVLDYGADSTGQSDSHAAFAAAIAASPVVLVPAGSYRLASTLHIRRTVRIEGEGGVHSAPATRLVLDRGVTGITVWPWDGQQRADGTVIADLAVVCGSQSSAWVANANGWAVGNFCRPTVIAGLGLIYEAIAKTGPTGQSEPVWPTTIGATVQDGGMTWRCAVAHGIVLHARAVLERISVSSMPSCGVLIEGSYLAGTNANNWSMQGPSRISGCMGDGLRVVGIDTNAGRCAELDCSANGGWGIDDRSFLGNKYDACHTDSNGLGAYRSLSAVAKNLFDGCYSESGQLGSWDAGSALWVGGLHAAGFQAGSKHTLIDSYCSALSCRASSGERSVTTTVAPHAGMQALAWSCGPSAEAYQLRLDHTGHRDAWAFVRAGSDPMLVLPLAGAYGYPRPALPQGLTVSGLDIDAHPKILTSGHRRPGDQWLDPAPQAGGYLGRVCVRAGWAAPTWAPSVSRAAGARVVATTDTACVYECVQAGASGAAEPAWSTTPGALVSDGGCVWRVGLDAQVPQTSHACEVGALVYVGALAWRCITAGTSGPTAPAWNGSDWGAETVDGTARWRLEGFRSQSAAWRSFGAIA